MALSPKEGVEIARIAVSLLAARDPEEHARETLGRTLEMLGQSGLTCEDLACVLGTMVLLLVRVHERTAMGAVLVAASAMMLHDPHRPVAETLGLARYTVLEAACRMSDGDSS